MAKLCNICSKKTSSGNNVSHSQRKTKRTFKPNIQKKKIFVPELESYIEISICSKCQKSLKKI